MKRTRSWYRRKFKNASFSDQHGRWQTCDLLWAFRAFPVVRLPVDTLRRCLHGTETDEPLDSDAFIKRALEADCRYPILCLRERNKKLTVMDGIHRLWKADHYKRATIAARIVTRKDLREMET